MYLDFFFNTGIFILAGLFLLIIISLQKNNNFLNISSIFIDYFKIFKHNKFRFFIFYLSPVLCAIGISNQKKVSNEILDNINIIATILFSVFFVLIDLISNKQLEISNENNDTSAEKDKGNFENLKYETISIITVNIILSAIYLIIAFVFLFIDVSNLANLESVWYILSVIVYSIVLIIAIHLLLIAKRFKLILDKK